MASRWLEFEKGISGVVKGVCSPEETRTGFYQRLDELLDRATINAYLIKAAPGGTTIEIGDLGEKGKLVVGVFGFIRRCRVGERLLTGGQTRQPVVALVEKNGTGGIRRLAYAEDIVGLDIGLPARVIDYLSKFNVRGVA